MTWHRKDDGFFTHPKVLKAMHLDPLSITLWTLAASWCSRELTDGFVPEWVADGFLRPDCHAVTNGVSHGVSHSGVLVSVGLWEVCERDGEPGFVFHDWLTYNPSRAQVEAERATTTARQRRYRAAKKATNAQVRGGFEDDGQAVIDVSEIPDSSRSLSRRDNGVTNGAVTAAPYPYPKKKEPTVLSPRNARERATPQAATDPQPDTDTEPTPTPVKAKTAKTAKATRGTRLTEDWVPTAKTIAWGRENHPDVDLRAETEKFRNYFLAAPGQRGVKVSWDRTWMNWIIEAHTRSARYAPQATPRHANPAVLRADTPRCEDCNLPAPQHIRGCPSAPQERTPA